MSYLLGALLFALNVGVGTYMLACGDDRGAVAIGVAALLSWFLPRGTP